MKNNGHIPVLLEEVVEYLDVCREGVYIDCTVGLGGHASEILGRNPKASLICFDVDEKSLLKTKSRLQKYADQVTLYHSDFRYLADLNMDFNRVRGVLLDLGISSFQLDSQERGFSYNLDGPLDMRMDQRNKITASRIINKYSEHHLSKILWEFGEFRQAKKLAHEIVKRRKGKKIETTQQLFRIIEDVCHWRPQRGKTHPAAKIFQAVRIEVNQELKNLSGFLERIIQKCSPGTRFVVISFHSLEDRIIKRAFSQLASPQDIPPRIRLLTKKPVRPTDLEIDSNFRARSAKLRAAERIR
jgi:16S rRNA (cytosine1402-N4)-methyltransferase